VNVCERVWALLEWLNPLLRAMISFVCRNGKRAVSYLILSAPCCGRRFYSSPFPTFIKYSASCAAYETPFGIIYTNPYREWNDDHLEITLTVYIVYAIFCKRTSCYFIIYADSSAHKRASIVDFRQIYEDVLFWHNYGIFIRQEGMH